MKSKSDLKRPSQPTAPAMLRPGLSGDAADAVLAVSRHYTMSESAATRLLILKGWADLKNEVDAEDRKRSA